MSVPKSSCVWYIQVKKCLSSMIQNLWRRPIALWVMTTLEHGVSSESESVRRSEYRSRVTRHLIRTSVTIYCEQRSNIVLVHASLCITATNYSQSEDPCQESGNIGAPSSVPKKRVCLTAVLMCPRIATQCRRVFLVLDLPKELLALSSHKKFWSILIGWLSKLSPYWSVAILVVESDLLSMLCILWHP